MKKLIIGFGLAAVIMAFSFANIFAADDWKSKYRDVAQIEGTDYFLIHLYDVQIAGETWYAAGVADKNGNIVLPVEYASIDTENYSDGRRLIATFGKYGFVDENFKIVIEPVYDRAWSFENGSAKVQKNNSDGTSRVFYIDKDGNEVPDPTPGADRDYDYYWSLAVLELNISILSRIGESDCAVYNSYTDPVVKYGLINVVTRETVSPKKWDNIVNSKSGEIWGQIKNSEGSYDTYIIGLDGKEDFKFKSEQIAVVWEKDFITFLVTENVKQTNLAYSPNELFDTSIPKLGLMDKEGNVIIKPVWETPVPSWGDENQMCRDGYLIGVQGSKNYEYVKGIGTMGDGKYGCVTTAGKVVIEPIYDNIQYNGNNKFTVTKDGETKTIDLNVKAPASAETAKAAKAQPTNSPIYVNGKKVDFEAYLIDGYNYFKLRDIACALNGTERQFEVGYNEELKAISLTTGKNYTVTGEELGKGDGKVKEARLNSSKIYLNETLVELTAYNIDGYNFLKLRDLGALLNFAVGYDEVKKSVSIDTTREYGDFVTPFEPIAEADTIVIAGQTVSTDVTSLLLNGKEMSDLSQLSELTNLRELSLAGNQITDLRPLAGLTKLTHLTLNDNQITDISPLSGLTELKELYIGINQITDISPLAGLTKLTKIDLNENQVADLTPLSGLTQLQILYLHNNQVADISPLADLEELTSVELGGNQVIDWSPVKHVEGVGGKP